MLVFQGHGAGVGGLGLNVTAATIGFFDANQNLLDAQSLSFPAVFNDCGALAPGFRREALPAAI